MYKRVLIDPQGNILAGHGRVLGARLLGMTEVPVIILDHLNENEKRAFMLADNRLALNAGWDEAMLRLELEALAEQDIDLSLTGFAEEELQQALAQTSADSLTDPDDSPEPHDAAVTAPGDLWLLGTHRVLCGDGTSEAHLERVLNGRRANMVFTDPPYNVDYIGKTDRRLKLVNDNLGSEFKAFLLAACRSMLSVNEGALYICMSSSELHTLYEAFAEAGGHWSTYIIWAKNTFTLGRSDYQRQFEMMVYGWAQGRRHFWCGKRDQGDVWFVNKPHRNDVHPTMKPVELIEQAITNSSRPGEVILDPFAGSGSTLIACERTGRNACLVEVDARYADVIVRRWQAYTQKTALRAQDGQTFDALAVRMATGNEGVAA